MAEFDPQIIKSVADSLYKRANSSIYTYSIFGTLLGAGIGIAPTIQNPDITIIIVSALIFTLIGFSIGRNKAASMKLEAQKILLDLQIEKNTRNGPE